MSHQAVKSFPWILGQQAHSARVVAAISLLTAGWILGIFTGRMSAWIFPVANPNPAALERTLRQTSSRAAINNPTVPVKVPEVTPNSIDRPTLALSPSASEAPQTNRANDVSPPPQADDGSEKKKSPREAVLLNPEWTKTQPSLQEYETTRSVPDRTDSDAIAKCASRFSSFRSSDGTYQPFGRSAREMCPFLR